MGMPYPLDYIYIYTYACINGFILHNPEFILCNRLLYCISEYKGNDYIMSGYERIEFQGIAKGWVYRRAFLKTVLIFQLKKNGEFFIS
jgi:hypothetical protein